MIKRYEIHAQSFSADVITFCQESENGEWVKCSDHESAIADLQKRIVDLESQLALSDMKVKLNYREATEFEAQCKELEKRIDADRWTPVSVNPEKYGKYFVHRKDGKIHWETWNGTGWAYNGNVITHWKQITPPNT